MSSLPADSSRQDPDGADAGPEGATQEVDRCPTPNPEPVPGQAFVIESVRFDRNEVTVRNVSGQDQTVTAAWRWCDFPFYGLMVEGEDVVLADGEALTVETSEGARLSLGGEMGLYRSDAYVEPDDLLAYVTWGSGTNGNGASEREPVAAMAGVWTFGSRLEVGVVDLGFVATGPTDSAEGYTAIASGCAD